MKSKSTLHISRKIYHVSGVVAIIAVFALLDGRHFGTLSATVVTVLVMTALTVGLDYLRIRHRKVQETLMVFQRVMRPQEMHRLSSMTFLMCGAAIVICFFPSPIVYLSLLMLAVGDPVSGIVGVLYGKDKILPNKSLQGTLAGFVACTLVSLLYFWTQNIMVERLVLVSLLSGTIGALAELIPVGKLDDNFIIPVSSAFLLSGLFYVFGGFS